MNCSNCGKHIPEDSSFCSDCAAKQQQQSGGFPPPAPPQPFYEPPMKWFKFLVYFELYLVAFVDVVAGFRMLGMFTNIEFTYTFSQYPGLEMLIAVFAGFCFFLAVRALMVRYRLKNFYRNAIHNYFAYRITSIAGSFLCLIALSAITGLGLGAMLGIDRLVSVGIAAVEILIERVYFQKRKHLFKS